ERLVSGGGELGAADDADGHGLQYAVSCPAPVQRDAGRGLPVRPALAALGSVERHRPVRLRLPATGAGVRRLATDALPAAAAGGVGGGNGPRGSVCGMPDLLE